MNILKEFKKIITILVFSLGVILTNSCKHSPYVLPVALRTGDPTICFERDVLPIFQSNCAKAGCHDASGGRSGYTLDSYQNIVRKGIVPGNAPASTIWQSISMHTYNVTFMPQNAPALSTSQLDVIKRWITTGAIDSGACTATACDTSNVTYSALIAPMLQTYCVGCHYSSSVPGGSMTDYSNVHAAALNGTLYGDISHAGGYNAMPLGGSMLDDCQIAQVRIWVAAGAPNN